MNVKAVEQRHRSLLDAGRVVGASGLDDFRARRAGLVVVVAVVGARAVAALVLTNVNDHAGGGGRGSVELILVAWSKFGDGTEQVIVDNRCGILRLFPPDWRRSRGGDQELFIWLRRLQARTSYVDGLGEIESHLLAVEVGLVQPESRLRRRQSIAETNPDPAERLEVLELDLRVEGPEQGLEIGLGLRPVEHFLVGHRGDQAEAVTLGGLDVHDG